LVREPLIWLGKADPVASQEVVRQTDPVLGTLLEVMQGWERVIGLLVPKTTLAVKTLMSNDLLRRSGETDDEWKQRQLCLAEFREALLKVAGDRNVIDTDRLGKWLRRYKGRIVAGRRFVNIATGSTAARWQLESLPMGNG
jgi:putative DNA primase/helicase